MHRIHIGVRVQCSGVDMAMTEKLLHHSQISPSIQGKGGKGMTAAVDRQAAYIGVLILQSIEEATVISREVPGMPQLAAGCAEHKLADTRQGSDLVGDLGH